MVERYVTLQPPIMQLVQDVPVELELQPLLLRRLEHEQVYAGTVGRAPSFRPIYQAVSIHEASLTATAVIDKLQRGEALHKTERPVWAEFRSPALEQTHAKGAEECSIVKAAFKIRNLVDVAYIRQTSNECERFSFVKSVWPGWPPRCVQMRYQGS
ncbi:hypothetical protein GQ600_6854 [Phytophthora cactorum]|nr:hypothetical protein GQ600_6854 [Phytophthora cactorum]